MFNVVTRHSIVIRRDVYGDIRTLFDIITLDIFALVSRQEKHSAISVNHLFPFLYDKF